MAMGTAQLGWYHGVIETRNTDPTEVVDDSGIAGPAEPVTFKAAYPVRSDACSNARSHASQE